MSLVDSRVGKIIFLVLIFLWIERQGAVLSVTDLPQIQRWRQPYTAENSLLAIGSSGLVLGIDVKHSSSSFQWCLR